MSKLIKHARECNFVHLCAQREQRDFHRTTLNLTFNGNEQFCNKTRYKNLKVE